MQSVYSLPDLHKRFFMGSIMWLYLAQGLIIIWVLTEPDLDKRFFMGNIMWLYQTQGMIIICAPVTDVFWHSYKKEDT